MKIEIFIEEGALGNKAGLSTSYYDTIGEATVILIDPSRAPSSPTGADAVHQALLSEVHDAFGNNGEKLIVVPDEEHDRSTAAEKKAAGAILGGGPFVKPRSLLDVEPTVAIKLGKHAKKRRRK